MVILNPDILPEVRMSVDEYLAADRTRNARGPRIGSTTECTALHVEKPARIGECPTT